VASSRQAKARQSVPSRGLAPASPRRRGICPGDKKVFSLYVSYAIPLSTPLCILYTADHLAHFRVLLFSVTSHCLRPCGQRHSTNRCRRRSCGRQYVGYIDLPFRYLHTSLFTISSSFTEFEFVFRLSNSVPIGYADGRVPLRNANKSPTPTPYSTPSPLFQFLTPPCLQAPSSPPSPAPARPPAPTPTRLRGVSA